MKSTIYFFIVLVGLPLYGISQEMSIQKINNSYSFAWDNTSEVILLQNKQEKFSFFKSFKPTKPYSMNFGFTAKQINSTSQFNHFSVFKDLKEIELLRQLDPNRNYPNHGIYKKSLSCQPYPLVRVRVLEKISIGL